MDLTPRLLTEVEFKEQWRGYSPTEVDQFLARVASAVADLQGRLKDATDRAMQAEHKLLERTDDDEIRRTLVLAQRTATSAVEEARAEATRLVEDARRQASEEEAQIAARVRAEVEELAAQREALQAEVDALHGFLTQERERLRTELQRQLAALDDPARTLAEPPVVRRHEPLVAAPEPHAPQLPTEEELARAREDLVGALRRAGVEPLPTDEPDAPLLYDADDESGAVDVPVGDPTAAFDALADDDEVDDREDEAEVDLRWAAPEPEGEGAALDVEDDDPFLTELRRAVTDDAPLGPRDDDDLPPTLSRHEDAVPSARFRLRRGR